MSIAEYIKSYCNDFGCKYLDNYSGRYMYGKKCIGIITDRNMLEVMLELADYLHECGIEKASEELEQVRWDNMGLDMVIYFPRISAI